jgi:hypothetical protein
MKKFLVVKRPHFMDRLFRGPAKRNPVRRHEHIPSRSPPNQQCMKIFRRGVSLTSAKNCATCSSRGAVQPVPGMLTSRIPSNPECARSFSIKPCRSPRRSNDGVSSQLLQLLDSFLFRLRPAIPIFIHPPEILNSKNSQFLCQRALMWRRSSTPPRGTHPPPIRRQNEEQK